MSALESGPSAPATRSPLGFAGGLTDADTGLVLFGARDFDPTLGRWIAKDPIGFAGGDVNLYGYCLGDPVGLVDPSGQVGQLVIALVVVFVVIFGAITVGQLLTVRDTAAECLDGSLYEEFGTYAAQYDEQTYLLLDQNAQAVYQKSWEELTPIEKKTAFSEGPNGAELLPRMQGFTYGDANGVWNEVDR